MEQWCKPRTVLDKPGRYSCFFCPRADFSRHRRNERCPLCGRPYGFPHIAYPPRAGAYRILRPIGLGFYSSVYLTDPLPDGMARVLKVIPSKGYRFFGKEFAAECDLHRRVHAASPVAIALLDQFEARLAFGDDRLDCHVMVFPYVGDRSLETLLDGALAWRDVVTIALGLMDFLETLTGLELFHNDLHADNILVRRNGLQQSPVVIDFGSMGGRSRSGGDHRSDAEWTAEHLARLREAALSRHRTGYETAGLSNALAAASKRLATLTAGAPDNGPILADLGAEIRYRARKARFNMVLSQR